MSESTQPSGKSKTTSFSGKVAASTFDMAVTASMIKLLNPQVRSCTLNPEIEHTISPEEETNSQLLDSFLDSCKETTPTHLAPAKTVALSFSKSTVLNLPLNIVKRILRNILTSPKPLILQPDFFTTPQEYRTNVEPNVLQVCKMFHNVGVPILYGENTLTTSSPATSFDFEEHLLSLPGSTRQIITNVKLEIDWADRLWAKFPLVGRALGELKRLRSLEIVIVEKGMMVEEKNRTVVIDKDATLEIIITYGQNPSRRTRTPPQRAAAIDRADGRVKREGPIADAMLKAEMKMLKDLVTGIKGLKHFRLIGFRHEVFAWCLEEHVRIGNH